MSSKLSAKALKTNAEFETLKSFDQSFGMPVCGIDEVGRGPLCGPVVAACAYIPPERINHPVWDLVNDSKKLSPQKREYIFEIIKDQCLFGLGEVTAQEIDEINIHQATLMAMKRAYSQIEKKISVSLALIDGKFAPAIPCNTHTVIKGDAKSLSIAAASILAKVTRDRIMAALHEEFPHYGWNTNAGYGTAAHLEGISEHGITPHHRKSFAPCRV